MKDLSLRGGYDDNLQKMALAHFAFALLAGVLSIILITLLQVPLVQSGVLERLLSVICSSGILIFTYISNIGYVLFQDNLDYSRLLQNQILDVLPKKHIHCLPKTMKYVSVEQTDRVSYLFHPFIQANLRYQKEENRRFINDF